jgi:hypothetical protein
MAHQPEYDGIDESSSPDDKITTLTSLSSIPPGILVEQLKHKILAEMGSKLKKFIRGET